MIRSLLIKGAFTEDDLVKLLTTFRAIERQRPEEMFMTAIIEADLSMGEAEEMMRRTFPRIEGDDPTFLMITPMKVICPDGEIRTMTPDIKDVRFDEDSNVLMTQGHVDIKGLSIRGEAWRRDGQYHFRQV